MRYNGYSVSVYLPRGGSTHSPASADDVLEKLHGLVLYYTIDRDGPGYEYVDVMIEAACAACGATGARLKPRRKHTYIECAACKGAAWFTIVEKTRVARTGVARVSA